MKTQQLHKCNVKKNDQVLVIAGKELGKKGKVLKVFPKSNRVIVEGLNFIKKSQRPSQRSQKGGIIEKEAPIHLSNVMVICARCNAPTRIGRSELQDGKRVRVCKKCGELLDK
ncbi:50S ribosomal protein L24 [bacterium]|nr:50S ribosomal protein L24 [candidate division CSSED10-310 bacterium]